MLQIQVNIRLRCNLPGFFEKRKDMPDRFIQASRIQAARPDSLHDHPVVKAVVPGHFQVQAGLHGQNAIIHCAPIAHRDTLVAPFLAQEVLQEPPVFAGVNAIHFVVGTHYSPRVRLFYCCFKGHQVDLAPRPFISHRTAGKTSFFLVVQGEMFQRGAHPGLLQSVHERRCQFPREKRIFGIVLKITPT